MNPRPTALIIDGERAIRRLVRIVLEQERYKVIGAELGQAGLEAAVEHRPDVIILELDLPDMDGLVVLERIREWSQKPVLILSERGSTRDKVSALDGGADDYVTKPFDTAELLARLRVIQRSLPGLPDSLLLVEGDLRVDLVTHEVSIHDQKVEFTPKEEALFYILARYAGKTVTHRHLVRCLWGIDADAKTPELREYVAHLRRKLASCGGQILIRNEASVGYCLSFKQEGLPEGCGVSLPG